MSINTFKTTLRQQLQAGGSETTIYLNSITTVTGEEVAMTDFLPITRGIITVDPENDATSSSRPEFISFTGIDTNAKTLTGCVRGLSAKSNAEITANKTFHPVDSPVIISFGAHNIQDLFDYIDDQVGSLTLGTNAITTAATAGETIASSDLVYLKESDGRWWKVDADTEATVYGVKLGIAQGAGTAGNAITNGVITRGRCTNFTGLTANTRYYASNTAGGVSTTAGTVPRVIGYSRSTTVLEFDPDYNTDNATLPSEFVSTSAGAGDAGKGVVLDSAGKFDDTFFGFEFGDGSDGDVTISSPTTLTRDMYYNNLTVNSTLTTDGYRIFVKETLSGNGTIDWGTANNGGDGIYIVGGGSGGAQSGSGSLKNMAGVAANSSSGSNPGGGVAGNAGNIGQNGALGGNGGGASGAIVGAGGISIRTWERVLKFAGYLAYTGFNIKSDFTFETFKTSSGSPGASGGNGSSGNSGYGGGSGASGGTILICAKTFSGTFTIKATGGNGGNGCVPSSNRGGGGGGAGGNGGCVIVIYGTKTWSGSYNLVGGTGGTGATGGGGANGANGSNGNTGIYYEIPVTGLV